MTYIEREEFKKMYDWEFTPDENDVRKCKGVAYKVRGGETYKSEGSAVWHGKQWMKETGRTGKIKSVLANGWQHCCISDY